MRIGIYKDTLSNKRGADVAVIALVEGLRERGHDTVLFEKADFAKRMEDAWDVVISTGTNELLDIYAYTARRDFPWPVVQQFHTNPKSQFKWKRFLRNWNIRQALRKVGAIQVLSESFVPQVCKYGPKVAVIGNWSKHEGFTAKDAKTTGKVVIYPAAFAKGKNQKLLIKAFAKVSGEYPDWRLRLLGRAEGRYADECRMLVAKLNCRDKVEFAGYSDDMASEYANCAFVAFPSLDEGFPLTIVDAAAFGKPTLMVKDWIATGAEAGGVLARPTVKSYADGLGRLMADEVLSRTIGENARKLCDREYSKEKILDKWESLLGTVYGKQ